MRDVLDAVRQIAHAAERQSRPVGVADAFAHRFRTHDRKEEQMAQLMVEDVFDIPARGVVVTGAVVGGPVSTGAAVRVERTDGSDRTSRCIAIEQFRRLLPRAGEGETVGLLLADLTPADVSAGDRVVINT